MKKSVKLFDVGVMIGLVLLVMGMVATQKDTDKQAAAKPETVQASALKG